MKKLYSFFFVFLLFQNVAISEESKKCIDNEYVTIAILAKDKEPNLPLFLECIEKQTWPTKQTYLYVRTNNNNDKTADVLRNWLDKVKANYAGIYFNDKNVEEQVQQYKQHEWNGERFKVLGDIRQHSMKWAKDHNSHYFVVDCDNFIKPHTLMNMYLPHLPIVAPFLKLSDYKLYSNYHAAIDSNGYYKESPLTYEVFNQTIKGLIQLPVVHCTYFIRNEYLDKLSYYDGTGRHEYVIFSESARKNNIPQYFDNRELYGRLTFADTKEELLKEHWLKEFLDTKAGQILITEQKEMLDREKAQLEAQKAQKAKEAAEAKAKLAAEAQSEE